MIRSVLIIVDLFIVIVTWLASVFLSGMIDSWEKLILISQYSLPILCALKILIFTRLGLYRTILKYASFHFATTIVKAVTIASFLSYFFIYLINTPPLSAFTMDWLITLFLVAAIRFFPRYFKEAIRLETGVEKKVLIYGAGDLGDAVARSLLKQKTEYSPIGFIDDDARKLGKKVHNLPILGSHNELAKIIKRHKINEIIIAITSVPADWLRNIFKECRGYNVFCRIAPKIADMMSNEVAIKNIDITDLLKRDPKDLDEKLIDHFLRNKKILITGAAGSIGSELMRQAIRFRPKSMALLDNCEYGLYNIEQEISDQMKQKKNYCRFQFILQDLCDLDHTNDLIKRLKPDIVFHAAAYKHVPLLEANPFSGIINNIQGTINIANAADQFGVEKFVLISTDKAVRPTNIMGATKRICELYIQNLNLRSDTEFVAVRFGNVLGSSGSVIPKFFEQIKNGGPLTVTHPNVTRYFMLTQEAVQLVMQAASIGHGGEIFILNMGEPVKIKEMAEDLIFLTGKTPYKDIDIEFTGLRPGEKLYEELFVDEAEKKTQYENITIGRMTYIEWNDLNSKIENILLTARKKEREKLLLSIRELVPVFNHVDLPELQPTGKVVLLPMKPLVGTG